jgi:penicillin-binding protein 1A
LRIVTTLDLEAQQAAEAAIAEVLTEPDDPQAALVALDRDGAIRAYVGGRDHEALQVDLAGGGPGRQPGSTFKPFVLAAALGAGITLEDRYRAPATIEVDVAGQPWEVENYGGESYGTVDVAGATADSVNTVYAQLLAEVGPQAVVDVAHATGIDAELEAVPAIALGAEEVAPLQLATGYATFANDGNRVAPYAIARIETADGDVVWEPDRPAPTRTVDEGVSRTVTAALRGVIEDGTGTGAALDRQAAGKTGTTQENVDAWFAGFVPGFTTVVWMGYAEGAVPMTDVHGRSVTGGSFPATIWQRFMQAALDGREVEEFPEPPEDLDRQRTPVVRADTVPDPEPETEVEETTTTGIESGSTTTSSGPADTSTTTIAPTTTVPGDSPPPDEAPPVTEAVPAAGAEVPAPP